MNNYDNAEPKVLKTLNSSGQVLNDRGNVIHDITDFWTEKYNQAEPKADKILFSDGTIKDSAGNLIKDTTEYNVQKYNQAEPTPAKYLHADGTIDENPGGGSGADLEDNKEVTIDVSTYTEPVEIEPTAGKDGMKKATVTLSNIPSPSGGGVTLYAWRGSISSTSKIVYTTSDNPQIGDKALEAMTANSIMYCQLDTISGASASDITIINSEGQVTFTRFNGADLTF